MKTRMFLFVLWVFVFLITADANTQNRNQTVASFTLRTEILDGRRVFVGADGKIDGVVNPTLFVKEWDIVEITLINADGLNHHIAFPDFFIISDEVMEKGKKTVVTFVPFKRGGFVYYCLLEGHRQLGMEGQMVVIRR
jgi:nitrite reductase (NO-forming)